MNRRRFLATGAVAIGSAAGCLGTSPEPGVDETGDDSGGNTRAPGPTNDDDLPPDDDPDDGYPPEFDDVPEARSFDTDSFETVEQDGVEVPLAPIEAAYNWYARGEARFSDARGERAYSQSNVYGAVLSPAPDGRSDDPVSEWPKGDRIVCYCGCPHHLSSMRAATLIDEGYEDVYVIDEGFWEWHDRNYPMSGEDTDNQPRVRVIRGETAATFAGETAWARHEPSGQREAGPIGADGTYELELKFADVSGSSVVTVATPAYRIEGRLDDLTGSVVTGVSEPRSDSTRDRRMSGGE